MRWSQFLLLGVALLFMKPNLARAVKLSADAGFELPMALTAKLNFHFHPAFYASGGVGFAPEFIQSAGQFLYLGPDNDLKTVISDSIANSIYVDLRFGWRPSRKAGYYIEAGYSYLVNGGQATDIDAVEEVMDFQNIFTGIQQTGLDVEANVHSLTVHGGYKWRVHPRIHVIVEGGLIKPIAAETSALFDNVPTSTQERQVEDELPDEIANGITSMFVLTVGAWGRFYF